jgi:hypothetical protein
LSAAKRGFGSDPAKLATILRVDGPETRNTAIAARPAPEAAAKMVPELSKVLAIMRQQFSKNFLSG